jgi:hypothetical protein
MQFKRRFPADKNMHYKSTFRIGYDEANLPYSDYNSVLLSDSHRSAANHIGDTHGPVYPQTNAQTLLIDVDDLRRKKNAQYVVDIEKAAKQQIEAKRVISLSAKRKNRRGEK